MGGSRVSGENYAARLAARTGLGQLRTQHSLTRGFSWGPHSISQFVFLQKIRITMNMEICFWVGRYWKKVASKIRKRSQKVKGWANHCTGYTAWLSFFDASAGSLVVLDVENTKPSGHCPCPLLLQPWETPHCTPPLQCNMPGFMSPDLSVCILKSVITQLDLVKCILHFCPMGYFRWPLERCNPGFKGLDPLAEDPFVSIMTPFGRCQLFHDGIRWSSLFPCQGDVHPRRRLALD